jgi:tetratricopeptide (TPR) repeat protein
LLHRIEPRADAVDARARAWFLRASALCATHEGRYELALAQMRAARAAYAAAGDLRNGEALRIHEGSLLLALGDYDEVARLMAECAEACAVLDMRHTGASARQLHGAALGLSSDPSLGRSLGEEAARFFEREGDRSQLASALASLARTLVRAGQPALARATAERAVREAPNDPAASTANAALAEVLLAHGAARPALDAATRAHALLVRTGSIEEGEELVLQVYAECELRAGDARRGAEALALAESCLRERARSLGPALRRSYLERVPECARIEALRREFHRR